MPLLHTPQHRLGYYGGKDGGLCGDNICSLTITSERKLVLFLSSEEEDVPMSHGKCVAEPVNSLGLQGSVPSVWPGDFLLKRRRGR